MKRAILICLICVFFVVLALNVNHTFCLPSENILFHLNGKIFNYTLSENIINSNLFDYNFEINKFKRFGTKLERQALLTHMLNLGFDKEISLNYIFPNLTLTINKIEKNIYKPAVDSTIKISPNCEQVFYASKELVGLKLDRNTLLDNLITLYQNNQQLNIQIPTIELLPNNSREQLMADKFLRADFSTSIATSSTDRKHNIKNALTKLNKTTIAPNQIFSFNSHIGRRTIENGYRQAKIIVNNEFVDGVGGGVCQVSSTLYNAALIAGLEIVEANKHSKQVGYVKKGFDAMVNFGSSDLKFKNNTNLPITIITNFSNEKARIRIFGKNLNGTKYTLTNEVFNMAEPVETVVYDTLNEYSDKVIYDDEFFYLKTASKGMEIKSFRNEYNEGVLTNSELLRHDKYPVQNAIKVYGNKKRTATGYNNFSQAVL